jgi:hypothetical protein
MHSALFRNHRHKFVLPRGYEGAYVVEEAFPLAQFLQRVELYLPMSGRTVLIDRESDLKQLLATFEASEDGQTIGPCIADEFGTARLIRIWLDHDPSEEELMAVWDALPMKARRGLDLGILETMYARGEFGVPA